MRIQRFLAGRELALADVWRLDKPHVRVVQQASGVLIIDDHIAEKPYTDKNDLTCWHYDHAKDRTIKGINFLTVMYHAQAVSLPVGFALVAKTEHYLNKEGKPKRRSPVSKNEYYQRLTQQAVTNQIPFTYVLNDVWYASADNLMFVKHTLHKEFIMPLKANRKVAMSLANKQAGRYVRVDTLVLEPQTVREVHLEQVGIPVSLVKQVFENDGTWNRVTSR